MTENGRTPCADVVDIFFPINVPNVGPLSTINEKWLATETSEGAYRGVDAARNTTEGTREELRRKIAHYLTFNIQRSMFNVQRSTFARGLAFVDTSKACAYAPIRKSAG